MKDLSSPARAEDLMNRDAVPLTPGTFPKNLALQFLSGLYGGWPVVDETRKLVGVITELRMIQAISLMSSLDELTVEETMTAPVSVFEHDRPEDVLQVMVQRQVMRIPVLRQGQVVGVISRSHLLRHYLSLSSACSARSVPTCVWCDTVQDSSGGASPPTWKAIEDYVATYHLSFSDVDLAHAYCPSCQHIIQHFSTASHRGHAPAVEGGHNRRRLLVVDDDPSVAELLVHVLQEWGYDVFMARNGRDGLELVNEYPVDGILLDMQMPVMDGRTMLDELRWLGHQMPVLMMSGEADERVLRQLLQEGAQGFFLKPFHLKTLEQLCHQMFLHPEAGTETERSSELKNEERSPAHAGATMFLGDLASLSVERPFPLQQGVVKALSAYAKPELSGSPIPNPKPGFPSKAEPNASMTDLRQ